MHSDPLVTDLLRFSIGALGAGFLPGLAMLSMTGRKRLDLEALGLGLGVSLLFWPLALLWTDLLGLRWSFWPVFVLLSLCLGMLVRSALKSKDLRSDSAPARWTARALQPTPIALFLLLCMSMLTRASALRGIVVAPWVDGFHHSLITRLFIEGGGIPTDYRPYLDVEPFFYHFGFHAYAAAIGWVSGLDIARTVLWTGQIVNALVPLTVFVFARRVLERESSAFLAAAIPASLYFFPAYFLTWGRYTQLLGLLVLPVVWLLVWDGLAATAGRRDRWIAAAAAGSMLLVHYRVFVFFVIGAGILALGRILRSEQGARRRVLGRFFWIAAAALLSAMPWLARNFAQGMSRLEAASDNDVLVGSAATVSEMAAALPDWLLTWGGNGFWLRLALVGVAAGLARGSWPARALAAWTALAALAVAPWLIGLPASWTLPPFSLAISAFLPVALGVGLFWDAIVAVFSSLDDSDDLSTVKRGGAKLGASFPAILVLALAFALAWQGRSQANPLARPDTLSALLLCGLLMGWLARWAAASPGRPEPRQSEASPEDPHLPSAQSAAPSRSSAQRGWIGLSRVRAAAPLLVWLGLLGLSAYGSWQIRSVVRADTLLVTKEDLSAMAWVRSETPPEASFLISTAHWHLGTYRGLDAGYWLPMLADRKANIPAALYVYGDPEDVIEIGEIAEQASLGDRLNDREIDELLDRAGADWIYVGPKSQGRDEAFSAARLREHSGLQERFDAGGVTIFERRPTALPRRR